MRYGERHTLHPICYTNIEHLPVLFETDGTLVHEQEPFSCSMLSRHKHAIFTLCMDNNNSHAVWRKAHTPLNILHLP
jgi:hypothetical protein